MTAATPEEEVGFAAFEQQVIAQGPKAVGNYCEEVFKGYLENLGLEFDQQVPFQGKIGTRIADFVIKQVGNIRNVAVDVKGGGPYGWGERGLTSLPKDQLYDYVYARDAGRFGAVLYANVPIGSNYGFSEPVQTALNSVWVGFKALFQ